MRKTLSFNRRAVKIAETTYLLHLETNLLLTHCYSLISFSRPSSAHHFSAQKFACLKIGQPCFSTFLSRVKQLYEILQAVSLKKECQD